MVSRTERENFTKRKENLYSLTHYEATVIAGNFNSTTKSIMQRLRNCFVNTYNNKPTVLPKWIVIVIENDLLRTVRCHEYTTDQLSLIFEGMLEWVFKELKNLRENVRYNMPFKTKKYEWPYFLWIEPTLHKSYGDNETRKLFNAALAKINAKFDESIIVNLQGWDANDATLFLERERRYSITGLKTLWNAIDRAVMYADGKMLRNHGKNLKEVFRQNGQQEKLDEQKAHSFNNWNRNGNTARRNIHDFNRQPTRRENIQYRPTFKHTHDGMRLPPPDRY